MTKLGQIPLEMFIISSNVSSIIAKQEQQGQQEFLRENLLPVRMDGKSKEALEKAGVKFLEICKDDALFQKVVLPQGWTKRATEHALWSELIDAHGSVRVTIFFKSVSYDRDAFCQANTRYALDLNIQELVNAEFSASRYYFVFDAVKKIEVFKTETIYRYSSKNAEERADFYKKCEVLRKSCNDWLNANFPDHEDPGMYWDTP